MGRRQGTDCRPSEPILRRNETSAQPFIRGIFFLLSALLGGFGENKQTTVFRSSISSPVRRVRIPLLSLLILSILVEFVPQDSSLYFFFVHKQIHAIFSSAILFILTAAGLISSFSWPLFTLPVSITAIPKTVRTNTPTCSPCTTVGPEAN